jgi:hypothetical protein
VADPYSIFVLIPDQFGLAVASVGDLMDRLSGDEPLEEAITNAAIDSFGGDVWGLVARVRALNETGDSDAYWAPGTPQRLQVTPTETPDG